MHRILVLVFLVLAKMLNMLNIRNTYVYVDYESSTVAVVIQAKNDYNYLLIVLVRFQNMNELVNMTEVLFK